jgi:hypothetical protein
MGEQEWNGAIGMRMGLRIRPYGIMRKEDSGIERNRNRGPKGLG